ncbi:GNAT family N-acetyltransferase [Aeromicrobium sp.]|nr:GNAT family N-acetyltransferase [Candidatus Saccharibacteria bacterium]
MADLLERSTHILEPHEFDNLLYVRKVLETGRLADVEEAIRPIDYETDRVISVGASIGTKLVSVASLERDIQYPTSFEMSKVATLLMYRRMGFGEMTVRRLILEAKERGAERIMLNSRLGNAQRLYSRVGFEPVGEAFICNQGIYNQRMKLEVE